MPKLGMEPIRRKQLIDATIDVIAEVGLHATTISLISKKAGLSTGIISHYFGGKQSLIESTMRYLLGELKIQGRCATPLVRIESIVDRNFSSVHRAKAATKTWLSLWAQSLHDDNLNRLQEVNKRRLQSNLRFSFRQMLPYHEAYELADATAAIIDGFWLRCALSDGDELAFENAAKSVKRFINKQLQHRQLSG